MDWADPGNPTYALFVRQLLAKVQPAGALPQRSQTGYGELQKFNTEHLADVVEAYLAAADAARKLADHIDCRTVPWHREYRGMAGGVFNPYDDTARFITDWMDAYHATLPPEPWPKRFRNARQYLESGVLPTPNTIL